MRSMRRRTTRSDAWYVVLTERRYSNDDICPRHVGSGNGRSPSFLELEILRERYGGHGWFGGGLVFGIERMPVVEVIPKG